LWVILRQPPWCGDSAKTAQQQDTGYMRPADWHELSDSMQIALSRQALERAAETLAAHAELLAREMEGGALLDQGGPDALRLFAAVVRATNASTYGVAGHA
jgi:hypothetical protein